jgi:hypothetical protein
MADTIYWDTVQNSILVGKTLAASADAAPRSLVMGLQSALAAVVGFGASADPVCNAVGLDASLSQVCPCRGCGAHFRPKKAPRAFAGVWKQNTRCVHWVPPRRAYFAARRRSAGLAEAALVPSVPAPNPLADLASEGAVTAPPGPLLNPIAVVSLTPALGEAIAGADRLVAARAQSARDKACNAARTLQAGLAAKEAEAQRRADQSFRDRDKAAAEVDARDIRVHSAFNLSALLDALEGEHSVRRVAQESHGRGACEPRQGVQIARGANKPVRGNEGVVLWPSSNNIFVYDSHGYDSAGRFSPRECRLRI